MLIMQFSFQKFKAISRAPFPSGFSSPILLSLTICIYNKLSSFPQHSSCLNLSTWNSLPALSLLPLQCHFFLCKYCTRRSNQSIVKEINIEYSLEGLMLKLQYFSHLMERADTLEKTWCWERLKAKGKVDSRGWNGYMVSLTQWTWIWTNSGK